MVRDDPNYQPGDVKAVFNPETGMTDNYFGGTQAADGDWHAHYRANEQGQVQPTPRDPGVRK